MATTTTFGANLRRARDAAHLTQDALAKRLAFKRTTPISIWERSTTVPEPKTIIKLAGAIGCSPATLLRGVVTPYDALRGYTARLTLTASAALLTHADASDDDAQWLALGRLLSPTMRQRHMQLLEAILREQGIAVPGSRDARLGRRRARRPAPASPRTAVGA